MRVHRQVLLSVLISLCLLSLSIFTYAQVPESVPIVNGMVMELSVYDSDGTLVHRIVEVSDLITTNFAACMVTCLYGGGSSPGNNIRGTNGVWGNGIFDATLGFGIFPGHCLFQIGIGTTPATIADYNLNSVYASFKPSSIAYHWAGGSAIAMNITFSGVHVSTGSASITEAGIVVDTYNTGYTILHVMIARDTFSAFPIVAGNTVTLKYTWMLNV